jgi:guanylate kinase
MPGQGILFILIGPSGAGKNTLMKPVQKYFHDLPQLPTVTTRAPRSGEQEGREHFFVSHDRFQELIKTGALVEYENVHMDDYYGTPRQHLETAFSQNQDLIADIDFVGAEKIHVDYPQNTVLIFVAPSNLGILAERIRQRGAITPEELAKRQERARFEMTSAPRCDYLIINDLVEPAIEHLRRIIMAERLRRRGNPVEHEPWFERPAIHCKAIGLIQQGDQLLTQIGPDGFKLPAFSMAHHSDAPHEILVQNLRESLGHEVIIEALLNAHFDTIAPHHVAIAAIPGDVYLYFYYKCAFLVPNPPLPAGWELHSPLELKLPTTVIDLLDIKTYQP